MAIERVNSVFDVPELKQEFDFFLKGMESNQAAIVGLYKTIEGYKGANFKTLTAETEKLTTAVTENAASITKAEAAEKKYQEAMARATMETVQFTKTNVNLQKSYTDMSGSVEQNIRLQIRYKKEMEDLKNQQKELSKAFGGTADSSGKLAAKQIEVARAIEENKAASAELGRTIRLQVKEQIAAGGSLDEMKAKYDRLFQVMRGLSDGERDSAIGAQLTSDLGELSDKINEIQKSAGNFSGNVGRYKGSLAEPFKILSDELTKIRGQLSTMDQGSAGFDELIKQEKMLSTLTEGLNREFGSATQEVRALQKAASTLGLEFGTNTEVFQKFKDQVGSAVDSVQDIQAQVKLAASDTRTLDGMIGAAEGLAGAYSIAEGSAALFGNSNEALMQTMVKLQAVMSILQGLQAIRNAMQAESAAMDFLQTVRLKALTIAQTIYTAAIRLSSLAMGGFAKAMLLTGIFTLIPLLVLGAKALKDFAKASGDAAEEQERMNEVSEAAIDAYAKEQTQMQSLTATIQKGGLTFKEKQKVLKDYNETFGDSIGKAKTFEEAESKIIELGPQYIEMLQLQAEAHAAFDLAVEETKKKLKAQQEGPELGIMGTLSAGVRSAFGGIDAAFAYTIDKQNEQVGESEKAAASFLKIQEDSQAKADAIKKKYGFRTKEEADKATKSGEDASKKALENAKRNAQALHEVELMRLKMKADTNKQILDNEKNMFTDRLGALIEWQQQEEAIIKKETDFLLLNANLTPNERLKIETEAQVKLNEVTRSGMETRKAMLQKQVEDEKAFFAQLEEQMKAAPGIERENIISNTTKTFSAIGGTNANEQMAELDALTTLLKNKEISIEEYNRRKEDINVKYNLRELSNAIALNEAIISNLKSRGADTTELEKQLVDQKKAYYEADAANFIAAEDKKEAARQKRLADVGKGLQAAQQIQANILAGIGDILSISLDKQKVATEELEAEQQKVYEAEVLRVTSSTATEEEKANRLKILESERMAQKEANERRQRKLDVERARFQKIQDIGNIISGTAVAVVSALATQPAPLGIALAAVVGALGAAQLARAIATPLPKYEHGTDSAKGGWALTDEKGAEMYVEPGGKTYLGSNQGPVMRYLKPGTKVIPADEVNQQLNQSMMAATARQLMLAASYQREKENNTALNRIEEAILQGTDATLREMRRNKKQMKIINQIDTGFGLYLKEKTFN